MGSLNYFAHSLRYDIAYATSRLSQFQSNPTVGARVALDRVLKYLRCTTDFRIGGYRASSDTVAFYTDSDHAGDRKLSMLSRTGTVIILNGVPVHWRSSLQTRAVAVSSAVAEIYATYDSLKECQLFKWRCQEMGISMNR